MKTFKVYFAGSLFNHKDLIGNLLLCERINSLSDGRYECQLPQNIENPSNRAEQVRNKDLEYLIRSDLAIFNFDGSELDSGTVVEFIFSKMIDMPCVILRSDFRSGGDQQVGHDQWNLMCSFYPRTKVVNIHSMNWYHRYFNRNKYSINDISNAYEEFARKIIHDLDIVRREPSVIKTNGFSLDDIYKWAVKVPGGEFDALFDSDKIPKLIREKSEKGIYD